MTTPNYSGSSSFGGESTDSGAKEQAKAAAGTAKEQAANVASTAKGEAQNVAGVAKQEAASVASDAKYQALNVLDQAKSQVTEQAGSQRDRLVGLLQDLSSQLEDMASGQGAPSGMAQDLVRQAADRARTLSSSIEGREPADLLEDVRSFARRKPGSFLLGALAAGVLAGRVTKGAKEANSSGSQGYSGVYDNPRGTTSGYPTAGVGYPTSDAAYTGTSPVYSDTDPVYPGTGAGAVGGYSTTATGTGSISPAGASGETLSGVETADSPWTNDPNNRGIQ